VSCCWSKIIEYLEHVFPRLIEFDPDFILISAGFDAHESDLLGTVSNIALNEFDYAWITRELVKISNMCCEGRIVSMLEGGYNTKGGGLHSPLGNSIYSHIYELSHDHSQVIPEPNKEFDIRKRKYDQISSSMSSIQATYTR
jgi:acetoin utilization deacetylase AcuC-like enzyme